MGIIAYRESISLSMDDPSFDALIMAAMRKADGYNLPKLQAAFPEVWTEFQARYNAPGGCLNEQETNWLNRVLEERDAEEESEDDNDT